MAEEVQPEHGRAGGEAAAGPVRVGRWLGRYRVCIFKK